MPDDLARLIEAAKHVTMSTEERENQRQSFAYGNAHIENELVTRDTVRQAAAEMRGRDKA